MAPTRTRSKTTTVERIANDSTRRATFKKRRGGLLKKASELATLCGVDACVVVFAEQGELSSPAPEVWPSAAEAARVIERFRAMPDLEQCKKMMNQETFMRERIGKLQEQLRKAEAENREREAKLLLHGAVAGGGGCPGLFAGLAIDKIASLGWMVERRIKEVNGRIDYLREQGVDVEPPPRPLSEAPSPYAVAADLLEVPYQQGCRFVDVPGAGGDLDAVAYGGWGYGSVGGGYACAAHPDLCFPPV